MIRAALLGGSLGLALACSAPATPSLATCVITSCYPHDSAPQFACNVPVGSVFTCDDKDVDLSWTGDPGATSPATCRSAQSACTPGLACLVETAHDGNAMGICQ